MNINIQNHKTSFWLGMVFIIILVLIPVLRNTTIITDNAIKSSIHNRLHSDVKLIKSEYNDIYKLVFFESNGKLGVSSYKLNPVTNYLGSEYLFSYNDLKDQQFMEGNDSYTTMMFKHTLHEKEVIIYGNNSNNSLDSILFDINGKEYVERIKDNKNYLMSRIIKNSDTFKAYIFVKGSKIRVM